MNELAKSINNDLNKLSNSLKNVKLSKNDIYIFELLKEKIEKIYYMARLGLID
jgi:predicted DNA-binding transcriptional regulator